MDLIPRAAQVTEATSQLSLTYMIKYGAIQKRRRHFLGGGGGHQISIFYDLRGVGVKKFSMSGIFFAHQY